MSNANRTVRVFLSSTFRDFAEERDLLVRKVFPELRRKCRERQVELVDVDLRWGITEEEAQQGKVLPICLAEIDRSRPFFMGFIGERYGWVPEAEKFDLSLIMEQPWLDEHRGGKSVTELEILHGVLNNPAMEDRAFFYFRDPTYSNSKGGAYLCEGPEEKRKLEALKERIRQSGYPLVEDYSTPEALAERVGEDLWKLIDEAYPASEVPDALTRERMRHEAFAYSRLGLYLGGESYFKAIDSAMSSAAPRPLLVVGDSGGGKSALLANWADRFSKKNPDAIVLSHHLATGADSAHPVNMAVRLLREISRITGEELVLEGDPRKALHMLGPWLAKAGAFALERGGVFVLVLDGLDKMDSSTDMSWWPAKLPEGVGLLASCLSGSVLDSLSGRMDWEKLTVSPLARADCEKFIADYLWRFRKPLLPQFAARVLDHPLSGNPLFLRTLLEELRVFGVHEELGQKLGHYLASATIDDLFEKVLERVEGDNSPAAVRSALEVLGAAKESFAEDELLSVSGLPPSVWAAIHIALDESLISAGGRLAFSHDYLKKAVEDRYLSDDADRQKIQKRMAEHCAQAMKGSRKDTSHYVRRHAVEHFLEVEDWDNATAALSDLEFIEARAIAQELPSMLTDYAEVVKLIPEGEKERKTEAARQAELDRYAREMYDYAVAWTRIREGSGEAEPTLPRPVESVRLWTEEEIAIVRKRITETPNRLDIVKAFRVFVATNSAPLQQYSTQEGFAANLARNDAPAGPVHEEGTKQLKSLDGIKLLKRCHPKEIYSPLTACQAVLEGHIGSVISLALDASARRVISGSHDYTLRIWDLESGECLKVLEGHASQVESVVLSKNSRRIISCSADHTIRIWDAESGQCLNILTGHTDWVRSLALSTDGQRVVSGSDDKTLRIWDVDTGECLRVLEGHASRVDSLVLSMDGRRAVSSSGDKMFLILDKVSGNADHTLRIWDVESGKCLKVLEGHTEGVCALVLTDDGRRVVSCSNDKTLRIWDVETGECLKVLEGHTEGVRALVLTKDKRRVVSGSDDKTLRIWDVETGECIRVLKGHKESVQCVTQSTDGQLVVSGSNDKTLRIWDVETGECIKLLEGHTSQVESIVLSADGRRIISGSGDNTLRIWGVETGECLTFHRRLFSDIRLLVLNTKGQCIVSGRHDRKLYLWNPESGQRLKAFEGHRAKVSSVLLSRDGRRIISGSWDNTLRLWDVESGKCLKVLEGHTFWVSSVLLAGDGRRIISGSWDKTLRLWDMESGECLKVLEGHTAGVRALFLSGDGRRVVSGSEDKTLRIWDVESGECLKVLEGHTGTVRSLVMNLDGRRIISGSWDKTFRLWDVENGKCLKVFEGHTQGITALTLSADGNSIFSVGYDNTLRLWDVKTIEPIAVFFMRGLSTISCQSATRKLFAGFYDGRVEIYDLKNLPLGPLITTAHREIQCEDFPAGPVTARPPCCGQRISIPAAIAERIEHWTHEGGEGGYTDPALLLDCPSCATPLRMNPFFVDICQTT